MDSIISAGAAHTADFTSYSITVTIWHHHFFLYCCPFCPVIIFSPPSQKSSLPWSFASLLCDLPKQMIHNQNLIVVNICHQMITKFNYRCGVRGLLEDTQFPSCKNNLKFEKHNKNIKLSAANAKSIFHLSLKQEM